MGTPVAASPTLTAVTTGNGATVDFSTAKSHVAAVVVPSGTIAGGTVGVQASHDGVNWVHMVAVHVALRPGVQSNDFSTGAYRYWRAVVLQDITGGGTVSATLMEAG